VSEVPETQRDARAGGAKDDAWSAVRDAQSAWAGAMRSHELAPPDAGFRDRLRALSEAADAMRATHARALEAGLAWRPVEGSERARPPYELRPGTGRRGPEELWERFDAAVERLTTPAQATAWPISWRSTRPWQRPPPRWPTRSRTRQMTAPRNAPEQDGWARRRPSS
jgi:hypothetical protein